MFVLFSPSKWRGSSIRSGLNRIWAQLFRFGLYWFWVEHLDLRPNYNVVIYLGLFELGPKISYDPVWYCEWLVALALSYFDCDADVVFNLFNNC